jgi:hypothetical protein
VTTHKMPPLTVTESYVQIRYETEHASREKWRGLTEKYEQPIAPVAISSSTLGTKIPGHVNVTRDFEFPMLLGSSKSWDYFVGFLTCNPGSPWYYSPSLTYTLIDLPLLMAAGKQAVGIYLWVLTWGQEARVCSL